MNAGQRRKEREISSKKDEDKSLLVNKFLKQLRTHLKSRLDAIGGSDKHTHTHTDKQTHTSTWSRYHALIDNITCEETWPMFFSSMKREQCHRLDSSLSVRFPQVHWKWYFRFLGFHSKCHDFFTRNWKQWFCISGMWFTCHKTDSGIYPLDVFIY